MGPQKIWSSKTIVLLVHAALQLPGLQIRQVVRLRSNPNGNQRATVKVLSLDEVGNLVSVLAWKME